MSKTKQPIYLFSKECPKGEMFKFEGGTESEEYKAMLEKGWFDSPAHLDLPPENDTGIPEEQAKNASPDDLKKLVESYGFIVVTPEQLKAEAVKMANVALDIENFSDEDLIAEAERRGLKQSDQSAEELNDLIDRFNEDPKALNKDELVALGNNGFTLGLRSNMKEDTLIEKITAALNAPIEGEAETEGDAE